MARKSLVPFASEKANWSQFATSSMQIITFSSQKLFFFRKKCYLCTIEPKRTDSKSWTTTADLSCKRRWIGRCCARPLVACYRRDARTIIASSTKTIRTSTARSSSSSSRKLRVSECHVSLFTDGRVRAINPMVKC